MLRAPVKQEAAVEVAAGLQRLGCSAEVEGGSKDGLMSEAAAEQHRREACFILCSTSLAAGQSVSGLTSVQLP